MEDEGVYLGIDSLPGETLLRIFYFLRPPEVLMASLVCQRWAQLLNEGIFWREYCEKKWETLHPVDERSKTWKQYFKERSILLPIRVVPQLSGSKFYAKVNRYEDVDTLKAIIEAELGIPIQDQIVSLTFQGKILRSGQLIGDYITQPGMSVSLNYRLRAGPPINNLVNIMPNNNNNNPPPGPGVQQQNN